MNENHNRDRLQARWPQLRGHVQERWSRLTDTWLNEVDGDYDRLTERLREVYGVSEQEATRQVDDFVETHWGAFDGDPGPEADVADPRLPGETRIRRHDERKSIVGPGTIEPGGRDL